MKLIIILFFAIPTCSFGQIYKHNRVFSDTTKFKDFNQGYIDYLLEEYQLLLVF